ncbi:replication associated protein [Chifec virus UA13_150]|nr:replication associated protein [Chifec virus UA13_150]
MADTAQTQPDRNGNKSIRLRNWCFTWNNYTLDDIDTLTRKFCNVDYVFQEETGEKGTPHLQGFVKFKNARYLSSLLKEFKGCYFEPCRNETAAEQYCQKNNTRTGKVYSNITKVTELKIPTYNQLFDWQKKVVELIQTEPDDRSIYWYWDREGCSGKTTLIKYICTHFKNATFTCASKSADIITIANIKYNIYLLGFARSQEHFAPYNAIEQLKDGLISDSKLKKISRNVMMNSPHVIVFANWPPDKNAISNDKWVITNLQHLHDQKTQHNMLIQLDS